MQPLTIRPIVDVNYTFEDIVMVMTGRGGERSETVMFLSLIQLASFLTPLALLSPSKTQLVLYLSRLNHKWY